MAFSMAGGGPSRPELNVTPLIDILLVLIIVFMVIVATSKEYKEYMVDTQLPQPANGEQLHQNERTIVIEILWSAQSQVPLLKINKESVPWEQLEPRLERIFLGARRRWCTSKATKTWISSQWPRSLRKRTMPA